MAPPKGQLPKNFAMIENRRRLFGEGAHKQCVSMSRTTKQRCKNPAAFGLTTCTHHGARRPAGERLEKDSAIRLERRYLCSMVFNDDLNAYLGEQSPRAMKDIQAMKWVGEKGRAMHAALQKIK